ncbi:MAG: hypothetical protein CMJ36_04505 [Phycisphaerae bacterium]|nr:hypothetical protein [Phycisphaerae bacterium]
MNRDDARFMQCTKCGHRWELGTFTFMHFPTCSGERVFRTCERCGRFCCQAIREEEQGGPGPDVMDQD